MRHGCKCLVGVMGLATCHGQTLVKIIERQMLGFGFQPRVGIVGENGTAGWKQLRSVEQIALARQADVLCGPSGNELGLGAFMREATWLLELMPQPVVTQEQGRYEMTNCNEKMNANPGSLVGHVALRSHVYHLCMNVNLGRVYRTTDLESPHWRFTPSMHVNGFALQEMLSLPFSVIAEDRQLKMAVAGLERV